jgi:ribonuclease-3 family protein
MAEEKLELKNYAHIGDAVWEVFVRDYVILKTSNSKMMHKMTTDRVNATFQKEMLEFISDSLTEEEHELVRRARNLPIPVGRKNIQHDYRLATAFEVLIGYWYKHDKDRLAVFYNKIRALDSFSPD